LELSSGTIELDGIDIKQVSLDLLRRRCFVVVTQDPLILSNESVRFNLDPDASASDELILDAIAKVGLWPHFLSGKMHAGQGTAPDMDISGVGDHPILDQELSKFQELSVGQCQLFALCRALVKGESLRRSGVKPVILLDEVTSSLDITTESTIHRIIDDEFTDKGHTVMFVTHRIGALEKHTKAGRDAVALVVDGRLQEVVEDLRPEIFQNLGSTG
jgi:ABC-type multidrug transport system fused ATPase/permease subunit